MLNKRVIILILSAMFLAASVSLFAQNGKPHRSRISWPAVQGAGGYFVEIKSPNGDMVYKQETETNAVYPVIAIGEYSLRITVLDMFKRPANETAWVKLSVIKSEMPEFEGITPEPLETGKTVSVDIKGDNFTDGCTVALTNGRDTIAGERVNVKSVSDIGCRFDLTNAAAGDYDIFITNSEGRKSLSYRKIRLNEPVSAVKVKSGIGIDRIRPSSFSISGRDVSLDISGENLPQGSSVVLSKGGTRIDARVESFKDGVLRAVIPAKDQSRGRYDVTVGRGNETVTQTRGLRMMDGTDGLLGFSGMYVGFGYNGATALSSWSSMLENSQAGGSVYLGHSLYGMSFFSDDQWMKHLGLELQGEVHVFNTKKAANRYTGKLYTAPCTAGVFVSVLPLSLPFELLLRGDAGMAASKLDVEVNNHAKKVISIDPFFSGGASLRFTFADYFFAETGGAWTYYKFTDTPMSGVGYFFRAGFRL